MMVAEILGVQYSNCEINPVLREQDTPEMTAVNTDFNYVAPIYTSRYLKCL